MNRYGVIGKQRVRIDAYGNPVKRLRMSKKERERFPSPEEIEYAKPYSHGPSTAGQQHLYYKGYPVA
jgi:hypothetical protein